MASLCRPLPRHLLRALLPITAAWITFGCGPHPGDAPRPPQHRSSAPFAGPAPAPHSSPPQGRRAAVPPRLHVLPLGRGPGQVRELGEGVVDAYEIDLEAGQYLFLRVDQR
ncbi:MAG: hypothetical protein M3O15_10455, partial [Acidobacteriota bacterium]|nr:hypothetical protein [Acidobacteriota bacterium]